MTKSKSQVLKEEFEIEFFDIVFLNSYGGRDARPMVWDWINQALKSAVKEEREKIIEWVNPDRNWDSVMREKEASDEILTLIYSSLK
jgi:hypothetical protein